MSRSWSRSRDKPRRQRQRVESHSLSPSPSLTPFGPEPPQQNSNSAPQGKGKQRADCRADTEVIDVDAYTSPPPPASNTASVNNKEDPPVPPTRPTPRPPRARGLLESVQAHLSSSSRSNMPKMAATTQQASNTTVNPAHIMSQIDASKSITEAQQPLPLLARLSDEGPPLNAGTEAVTRIETEMRVGAQSDASAEQPRLSAPEIMARTRARLASLKNEAVAGVPPTSVALSDSDSVSPGNAAPNSSREGARVRLLNRLELAKRQTPSPNNVVPDPALSNTGPNPTTKEGLDSQAELKLRMQAQVRIRLAAEKRAADGGYSQHVDGDGREESLRAKLKERRI